MYELTIGNVTNPALVTVSEFLLRKGNIEKLIKLNTTVNEIFYCMKYFCC